MKKMLCTILISFVAVSANAADVGVSISVGQPGFYGRIDIGNAPRPEFLHPQPVIIQPAPRHVVVEPIYLRVPPGHAKKWKKHCAKYDACGRPVYFVRDSWYEKVYVPHYRRTHGRGEREHGRDGGRGQSDRNDNDRGERGDRGGGRGHGRR